VTAPSSTALPATSARPGPLALVGGAEWRTGCSFDEELWDGAGRPDILVLPTAAAYEHPERATATATTWLAGFGAVAHGLGLLARPDAFDPACVAAVRSARFVYLSGGSPLHLRSVLKDSPVWDALVATWWEGAVVAGSSAGAMVLGDPMVDPRGGALTLGLGLVAGLAVLPHSDLLSTEKAQRTVSLATGDLRIATVDERTALVRSPDGTWRVAGAGQVAVWAEGRRAGTDALDGLVLAGPGA
jgi:cyanophycinase